MKAEGLEKQGKYTRDIGSTSNPNDECNKDEGEKRDKMLTQMVSWNLPQDITSDILSRLPTKSVMQCRCVCKAWRALLENPDFINMHLFHPSQAKTPSLVVVTIDLTRDDSSTDTLPVINMDYNAFLIEHMLELRVMSQPVVPLQVPAHSICASRNGLLCLSSFGSSTDTTTWICNPFTRETVPLPRFSIPLETVNGYVNSVTIPGLRSTRFCGLVMFVGPVDVLLLLLKLWLKFTLLVLLHGEAKIRFHLGFYGDHSMCWLMVLFIGWPVTLGAQRKW